MSAADDLIAWCRRYVDAELSDDPTNEMILELDAFTRAAESERAAAEQPCPHLMVEVQGPEDERGFCTRCGAVAPVRRGDG